MPEEFKGRGFITLGAKLRLNVHDLNNEATAGNVTDIRMISMIDETGEPRECTGVSGRMLKHFHYEYMRKLEMGASAPKLCTECKQGEPMRPRIEVKEGEPIEQFIKRAIENCVIDDAHGFLAAELAEKFRRVTPRRDSRILFSWLLPTMDTLKQVVHTRVSKKVPEVEKAQMIYYKSYASGIYAFVSAFDAERLGWIEYPGKENEPMGQVLNEEEWRRRVKNVIEAYRLMATGAFGASLSHALAHAKCEELVVAISGDQPLPVLTSPIYKEYLEQYVGLLKKIGDSAHLLIYEADSYKRREIKEKFKERVETFDELGTLFDKIKEYLIGKS